MNKKQLRLYFFQACYFYVVWYVIWSLFALNGSVFSIAAFLAIFVIFPKWARRRVKVF